MATYTIYQCSVCRRTKDIQNSNSHAFLNYCVITKNCSGRLFPIGESPIMTSTLPVAGVTDWYPNGTLQIAEPAQAPSPDVSLSCSDSNSIILAVLLTTAEKDLLLDNMIQVVFEQRKTSDISYQQYLYRAAINQTIISGKDRNGINMRFDQAAIDDNRIFVRVNGVAKFVGTQADEIQLSPNTITFNSVLTTGSTVSVAVFQEKNAVTRVLNFQLNAASAGVDESAWSNAKYFEDATSDFTDDSRPRWWIFTCNGINLLSIPTGATLRLLSVNSLDDNDFESRVRFLLAKAPFSCKDRYLNLYCDSGVLHKHFALTVNSQGASKYISAISESINEVFPPFVLLFKPRPDQSTVGGGSFLLNSAERIDSSSSAIIEDDVEVKAPTKYIIGPL